MHLKLFLRKILKAVRTIPLLGHLIDCKLEDFSEAFKELITILTMSTLPLTLGALLLLFTDKSWNNEYFKALLFVSNNGELFLYSASLIAPIYYIAMQKIKTRKEFPSTQSHIFLVSLIMFISIVFFNASHLRIDLNDNYISNFSRYIFIISTILLYLALVYRNSRMSTSLRDMKETERNYVEDYSAHRSRI